MITSNNSTVKSEKKSIGNIDSINGYPSLVNTKTFNIYDKYVDIIGWIIDIENNSLYERIILSIGDYEVELNYNTCRQDVVSKYNNKELYKCGFMKRIEVNNIKGLKKINTISILGVDKKNIGYELPLKLNIKFKTNVLIKNISGIKKTFFYFSQLIKNKVFIFSVIKNIFTIIFLKLLSIFLNKEIIIINFVEHLGDLVACEPIVRYIRNENKASIIIWLTKYQYLDVIKYNSNINFAKGVTSLFEWMIIKSIFRKMKKFDLHIDNRRCTLFNVYNRNPNKHGITLENYYNFGSLLEAVSLSLDIGKISDQPKFYFSNKKINIKVPEKSIVIHCVSNELCRNWDLQKWYKLVERLISDGYYIIEIGLKNVIEIKNNNYINYCGKLSLQEIAFVIKQSFLFVGIDSSFAHFANAVGTPGVILLGNYRIFKKYMPYTGSYSNGKNATIIQHEGEVKKLSGNRVYIEINKRLVI